MQKADLIVIGAGPGGFETAAAEAAKGRDVVIIERDLAGGTCLNRGCIPTKCLCASASTILTVKAAAEFGINIPEGVTADYGIPVANGVLTCENDEQCKARTAMKGKDCAQCAVEMARLAEKFPSDFADYDEDDDNDR